MTASPKGKARPVQKREHTQNQSAVRPRLPEHLPGGIKYSAIAASVSEVTSSRQRMRSGRGAVGFGVRRARSSALTHSRSWGSGGLLPLADFLLVLFEQFDDSHGAGVAQTAIMQLDDAGIAAGPFGVARSDLAE
ncbi:MAG: hypothetical protein KatS3mg107_1311 [Gemmataceae bacterium]|jgi:hypothetical protein|nr:MAG: hypothetical protein KatS3mg107_1311 [Gemmataceae bacterium]